MNMKKCFNKIIVSMLIAALMFSGIAVSAYGNAGEQLNISVKYAGKSANGACDGMQQTYVTANKVKDDFLILPDSSMSRISRVEIDWAQPTGENIAYYKLLRSFNGTNYQEIKDRASGAEESRNPDAEMNFSKTSYITSDTFDRPVYVKMLKLSVFKTSANKPVSIREIRVYGESTNECEVVSKAKAVTFLYGDNQSADGKQLTDGNYTNGIEGYDNKTRFFDVPFGAMIDLGGLYSLSEIYSTFTDRQKDARNYYSYTVSVSTDGENFTAAAEGNKTSKSGMLHNFMTTITQNYWGNGFYLTQNSLNDVYARYVRVDVTGCTYKWVYGIKEIEIIGKNTETAAKFDAEYADGGTLKNVKLTDALKNSPLYTGSGDKKSFIFESAASLKPLAESSSEVYVPDEDADKIFVFDVSANETVNVVLSADEPIYAFQTELVYNPSEVELVSCKNADFGTTAQETDNGSVNYIDKNAVGYFSSRKTDKSCRILACVIYDEVKGSMVNISFRAKKNTKTVMYLKGSKCLGKGVSRVEKTENCLALNTNN